MKPVSTFTDMNAVYGALIRECRRHPESGIPELVMVERLPKGKGHTWILSGKDKKILLLALTENVEEALHKAFADPDGIIRPKGGDKYYDTMADAQRLFLIRATRISAEILSAPCPQIRVRPLNVWVGYADCPKGAIYISYGTGENETIEELLHTTFHEVRHIWQWNNGLAASEPNPKRDLEAYMNSWCETDAEAWSDKVLTLMGIKGDIELDEDTKDRQLRIPVNGDGIYRLKKLVEKYREAEAS